MSKIKRWQCPHCTQDSARHWNLAVHIRRGHRGIGRPIEKGFSCQEGNPIRTHINRRDYANPYNSSRNSVNYFTQASRDEGDIINDTYQIVTEMDEKRRKVDEIIEITSRYLQVPIQTPCTDPNVISVKDMMGIGPPNTLCHGKPHPEAPHQPYDERNEITNQKTRCEKRSQDPFTSHKGETKWSSNGKEYLVDPEGDRWDVTPPAKKTWVRKLDMFGNVIDMYKVIDPIEELRDIAKQYAKSNILYQ